MRAGLLLLAMLSLVGCSPKPKPAATFSDAKAALQTRLGGPVALRQIATSIGHGKTSICGVAAPQASPQAGKRFVYADGKLVLESDVSDGELRRLAHDACPDFAWPTFAAPQSQAPKP